MGATYKQEYAIQATYKGKDVEQGLKGIDKGLDKVDKGLKKTSKSTKGLNQDISVFAANLKANLTARALTSGLDAFRGALRAVKNEYVEIISVASKLEVNQQRLETSLKISGTSWDEQADKVNKARDALWEYAGVGESTSTEVLSKLISYTGDLDKAIMALQPTFDLAIARGIDLDSAALNLGKTFGGLPGELGETIRSIAALSIEELKAGKATEAITKMFGGQATAFTKTFSGSIAKLGEAFKELDATLGKDTTGLGWMISDFADSVKRFADSPAAEKMSKDLGSIASNIVQAVSSIMGKGGSDSIIDAIDKLLSKLNSYTSNDKFVSDLRAIGSLASAAAKALNTMVIAYRALSKFQDEVNAGVFTVTGMNDGTYQDMRDAQKEMRGYIDGGPVSGPRKGYDHKQISVDGDEYVLNAWQTREAGVGNLERWRKSGPNRRGSGLLSGGPVDKFLRLMEQKYKPADPDRSFGMGFGERSGMRGGSPNYTWAMNQIQAASSYAELSYIMEQNLGTGMGPGNIGSASMTSSIAQWARRNSSRDERQETAGVINEAKWKAMLNKIASGGRLVDETGAPIYNADGTDISGPFKDILRDRAKRKERAVRQSAEGASDYFENMYPDSGTDAFMKEKYERPDYSGTPRFDGFKSFASGNMIEFDNNKLAWLNRLSPEDREFLLNSGFTADFITRHQGGTIPGGFGRPVPVMAYGGEEYSSPAKAAMERRGEFDGQSTTRSVGRGRFGAAGSDRGRRGGAAGTRGGRPMPEMQEQAVGMAIKSFAKTAGVDLTKMQMQIEENTNYIVRGRYGAV